MESVQWTVSTTPKTVAKIFEDASLDCPKLPGFIRLQLAGATAAVWWGGSNVTNAPANAGGGVANNAAETLVARKPNTLDPATLYLVGTDGTLHLSVG